MIALLTRTMFRIWIVGKTTYWETLQSSRCQETNARSLTEDTFRVSRRQIWFRYIHRQTPIACHIVRPRWSFICPPESICLDRRFFDTLTNVPTWHGFEFIPAEDQSIRGTWSYRSRKRSPNGIESTCGPTSRPPRDPYITIDVDEASMTKPHDHTRSMISTFGTFNNKALNR
jgi:hypothetical protein